jgi:hypothetical protein
MFEMIGLVFGLFALGFLSVLLGGLIALGTWFLFWGRPRPGPLILTTSLVPIFSLAYVIFCGIVFSIFVPNQPDVFFGDFSEPLPHGYVLSGLGKMPEYSYFESTPPMMHQPPLLGGVKSLEQDGELIFGAYGHMNTEFSFFKPGYGYFVFDTRSGDVENFATLNELNMHAGHQVHLVDSQLFRSKVPSRVRLRKVENMIYACPPVLVFFFCLFNLLRYRIRSKEPLQPTSSWPEGLSLNSGGR